MSGPGSGWRIQARGGKVWVLLVVLVVLFTIQDAALQQNYCSVFSNQKSLACVPVPIKHIAISKDGSRIVYRCKECEQAVRNQTVCNAGKRPAKRFSVRRMFSWPMKRNKFWISAFFGTKERGRLHAGIDLAALRGTPVYAAAEGIVEESRSAGSFGNMVLLRHIGTPYKSRYAHLHSIATRRNERVARGELIGYVGNSGRVSGVNGDHLHFEILQRDRPINPMKFLR